MNTPDFIEISDREVPLEEAQRLVGGTVERVVLPDKRIMLVNEEGVLDQLPHNVKATALCPNFPVGICGPAVILSGIARKGWR